MSSSAVLDNPKTADIEVATSKTKGPSSTKSSDDVEAREDRLGGTKDDQEGEKKGSLSSNNAALESSNDTPTYLKGLKLHLITAAFSISLFLTNLEIPIVTTSLISITNDLNSFDQSSWIISAYMLGYVSMVIIWAKISDILGRKLITITVLVIFTAFSGACGASQSMTQLITLRAFQGLGGGGNYALATIVFIELVPKELYAKYTSGVSVVFSLSLLFGPIIGGALNSSNTWRWVFLLNVPIGVFCIAAVFFCMPADFPYQGRSDRPYRGLRALMTKETLLRVDFLGAGLLFVGTTFLVAALEEAGRDYSWRSAFVISLLAISGVTWIVFVFWERVNTLRSGTSEPVFPWRLMTSRVWIGMVLNALFLGAPWFVTIFQLPQRFQVINNASALSAGFRLIPFTLAAPFGSAISAAVAGKFKLPPLYIVIGASCLQVIGFALLSILPLSGRETNAQYGYQIIAGFGVGINISTLVLMTPFSVKEPRDQSVALGSIAQFRIMGGVIGLAIVTAAYKGYVQSRLEVFLTPDQRGDLLKSVAYISTFDIKTRDQIQAVFAGGYNLQFRILIAFAAAQIPSSILMWQKKQIRV